MGEVSFRCLDASLELGDERLMRKVQREASKGRYGTFWFNSAPTYVRWMACEQEEEREEEGQVRRGEGWQTLP